MSIKNLVRNINKERFELEKEIEILVGDLLESTTAANYLYSKQIDEIYFHLNCIKIDENDFLDVLKEIKSIIKKNKGEN